MKDLPKGKGMGEDLPGSLRSVRLARGRIDALLSKGGREGKPIDLDRLVEETQILLKELESAQNLMRCQIDELVRTRAQLEIERKKYREFFDLAPDAYFITDIVGIVSDANRRAAQLLDVPQNRLIGKLLAAFVTEASREAFHRRLSNLHTVSPGEDWHVRFQPRMREPFVGAITLSLMWNENDRLVGLRWLVREIAKREKPVELSRTAG